MPKEFKEAINEMPFNLTVKRNALKIYAALLTKKHLENSLGYFPVSSAYLASINKRYYKIMEYFIEKKLIDYYKKAYTDENDIFNTVYRKAYNKELGITAKYRFLVNVEAGDEINVDMITNRTYRWYEIIEKSLEETTFPIKIKRDSYGRRVHHTAIKNYKTDFKGYYTIDAVCSQPRLLYNHLKEKGIVDPEYNRIFESNLDFYMEVASRLNFQGSNQDKRNEAKDLFMHWINGHGYVPNFEIHNLFRTVSLYLKGIKRGNYKNSGSLLQRIESKIWIDGILNNIPCDFAIPIHDCVIVKEQDADMVLNYCKHQYPNIKFKKELIK
ncbi:hypothetical protein [Mucilaginibacter ginsenosidivorans]|uniref:DNA-directed DNA polymerase family A palm domain-containing protein n=1 Tax=Mucilaginibacter ginsenosidivorans TaxID=398053 RepID=A0A5B8URN1_9SPHI|nr:hypothetical protein [Mucilaginibacter ginsenosidivorans]QEC61723.1 hypothetical protein FRZ54_03695 [Mucilaginibacter ginsenosidivorans]